MSAESRSLMPAARGELATAAGANALVARGLSELTAAYLENATGAARSSSCDHYERGKAFFMKQEYVSAIEEFDEAIQLNPSLVDAYYFRGSAWRACGDFGNAFRDCDEAVKLDPNKALYYYARGRSQRYGSIADMDKAIQLDPEFTAAYLERGIAWAGGGCSETGIAYAPGNEQGPSYRCYDKAIKDFDKAIYLNPNNAAVYDWRARCWLWKGIYTDALKDHDAAIRLDPDNARLYAHRGMTWLCKGEYDKAIRDYDQAIRQASRDMRSGQRLDDWLSDWATDFARFDLYAVAVRYQSMAMEIQAKTGRWNESRRRLEQETLEHYKRRKK